MRMGVGAKPIPARGNKTNLSLRWGDRQTTRALGAPAAAVPCADHPQPQHPITRVVVGGVGLCVDRYLLHVDIYCIYSM